MDEAQSERIAAAMIDRYGDKALNKAVRAARKYVEDGNIPAVRDWVEIGQKIRALLDNPDAAQKARAPEEA